MHKVLLVLVATVLLTSCATMNADKASEATFQEAVAAHKAGDYERSYGLAKKAAEAGNLGAQNLLAFLYINGQGVARDTKIGFAWMKKAAEGGHAIAQFNMGVRHENAMEDGEAFGWYCLAAVRGYTPAKPKTLHVFQMCKAGSPDACGVIKQTPCAEEFYNKEGLGKPAGK